MGIAVGSNDGMPTSCVCTLLPSDTEPNGNRVCPGEGAPPQHPGQGLSVPTHSYAARRRHAHTRPHAHVGQLAPNPPREGVVGRERREAVKTGNV